MPHKFAIGDRVRFHHERTVSAAHGPYLVTIQLPERDGEFQEPGRAAGAHRA